MTSTSLSYEERFSIPRASMHVLETANRVTNFQEVPQGLTERQAITEALRCLNCKDRPCVAACPLQVPIPEFIAPLSAGALNAATKILGENPFSAICGRICPADKLCEAHCVRNQEGTAVAIAHLERFVGDWETNHPNARELPPGGGLVAICGSGPASLTAAGILVRRGHQVRVFASTHQAGGVLRWGIPEFRLPRRFLDQELALLCNLGVNFSPQDPEQQIPPPEELLQHYDAVYLPPAAAQPFAFGVPGEDLQGVYLADDYLRRTNLMTHEEDSPEPLPVLCGKFVTVVGSGERALDCARTARRLGAERSILVNRHPLEEMRVRNEDLQLAIEEGVELVPLAAPIGIHGDGQGWVDGLLCQKLIRGEPDESGRRPFIAVEKGSFELPAQVVINALDRPRLLGKPEIETGSEPQTPNPEQGQHEAQSLPGVFCSEEPVEDGRMIMQLMSEGKRVALSIDRYLRGNLNGSV